MGIAIVLFPLLLICAILPILVTFINTALIFKSFRPKLLVISTTLFTLISGVILTSSMLLLLEQYFSYNFVSVPLLLLGIIAYFLLTRFNSPWIFSLVYIGMLSSLYIIISLFKDISGFDAVVAFYLALLPYNFILLCIARLRKGGSWLGLALVPLTLLIIGSVYYLLGIGPQQILEGVLL